MTKKKKNLKRKQTKESRRKKIMTETEKKIEKIEIMKQQRK